MNFLNRIKFPALVGALLVLAIVSCEQELTTIGDGVIGGQPFTSGTVEYDVFAFNKKIEAVQTNKLPLYQLGRFNDPIYGATEASITTQVQLPSANPTFGIYSQNRELTDADAIAENETIDSVVVYLPYQLNNLDSDNDGVPDSLEEGDDILDATNDSDNDGIPNNTENAGGTNPLNPDTDGDGIGDADDDTNDAVNFAKKFKLDSIYGDTTKTFNFKVERSTFFLRDLDPNTNFQNAQEYYSSQQFSPTFTEEVFFDDAYNVNNLEFILPGEEDDPDTEEDETTVSRLAPGIRVKLNAVGVDFFQENILDKEGDSELLSNANFKEFFKGVHLSVIPDEELLFLLNISNARIEVYYHYDRVVDGSTVEIESSFNLSLFTASSNAVNTFTSEAYPDAIANAMDVSENASRLYLKGGSGSYAEINLFDTQNGLNAINEIKANNWVINEASLVFYVDQETLASAGGIIEPPRLYLYNAETNQPLYDTGVDPVDNNTLASYPLYDGLLEADSSGKGIKYSVRITNHINNMVVRDSTNATLGLTITPDIRIATSRNAMLANDVEKQLPVISTVSPLSTVLLGSEEIPGKEQMKLKLEISYTEVN